MNKLIMKILGDQEKQKRVSHSWMLKLQADDLENYLINKPKGSCFSDDFENIHYVLVYDDESKLSELLAVDRWTQMMIEGNNRIYEFGFNRSRGVPSNYTVSLAGMCEKGESLNQANDLKVIESLLEGGSKRPKESNMFSDGLNQISLKDAKLAVANYYGVDADSVTISICC
ncbi:hypothetical protein [Marinospirillum insulare]|uniref:Uncharacterized protein n=1 Tax=Marinospirillum insulare TaxID=217169 RepID=A0ABQ5ZSW4_9GAMM|nr:hypothetical protein [Marinospirillum insulare]GLR63231.1 hypothetical protein GCM10007878_06660 [Marinospirillum insulare]